MFHLWKKRSWMSTPATADDGMCCSFVATAACCVSRNCLSKAASKQATCLLQMAWSNTSRVKALVLCGFTPMGSENALRAAALAQASKSSVRFATASTKKLACFSLVSLSTPDRKGNFEIARVARGDLGSHVFLVEQRTMFHHAPLKRFLLHSQPHQLCHRQLHVQWAFAPRQWPCWLEHAVVLLLSVCPHMPGEFRHLRG